MSARKIFLIGLTSLLCVGCTVETTETDTNTDPTPEPTEDLCATNNGGCDALAQCSASDGAVQCECPSGYEGDGFSCSDVDECATNNGGCDATYYTCTNNVGADPTCVDIDECATNNGGCDATYYTCTNNDGAAPTCVDIDECATDNGGCGDATYYSCTNNDGATPTCGDIDECLTDNGGCGDVTYYSCTNNDGEAPTCDDIDECATNNGGCDATYYTCTNNDGAAPTCVDIDECATNNGGCDASSYTCTNNDGAIPTCVNIDECASSTHNCDANATCTDSDGSFGCECNTGYSGDGVSCSDIDECAGIDCGAGGTCSEADGETTSGQYTCSCASGYEGGGTNVACTDIDECATNNGGCDATYETCTNNTGAAPTCVDINECATNNGGCDAAYETCTDNTGVAPTCVDINECATNNGGCGNTDYYTCIDNTGEAPTCANIAGCDEAAGNCDSEQSYPENPVCEDFKPICDDPPGVPWPNQEMWSANGNTADGAVRVLEGSYSDFQDWNAANTSYDHSSCVGETMRDCCLLLDSSTDGTDSCPVPYNDQVLTVVEGDRLTVRLPPSPCDSSDTIPLSGYSKVTAESVRAHQIGLCRDDDGTQYGCIHIDGTQAGPASLLVTAYYGTRQGECSAASSFGTSELGGASSSVLTSAFGAGLDDRFNEGQSGLPACCLNTMMLTVNVVEPIVGETPPPIDRDFPWAQARMAKGGVMLCNISVPICQSMQEQLRTVIATHTASFLSKNDTWLRCESGDFQNSNIPSGVTLGGCGSTSYVNYEVYMSSQYFVAGFLGGTPGLQTLLERNDGTQNETGFINGSQPYNYVFVEALKQQIEDDGLDDTIVIGQAKASLTDYQVYKSNAASDFNNRTWDPMGPSSWGEGVTSLRPVEALSGRTTVLSSESEISNCASSSNPYCVGLARHNELRAEAGLQELAWDADLATTAKTYADDLCNRNEFGHSEYGPENLYASIPNAGEDEVAISDRGIMLARAVESWSLERNFYNYARAGAPCQTNHLYTPGEGADSYSRLYGMTGASVWDGAVSDLIPAEKKMTGHFTLMMQALGTKIGCGAVRCSELGPTDESMLSAQNRWVVACHYDKGSSTGEFPFSERAAYAFRHDMETTSQDDDSSLCIQPCDGAMTTAERAALQAIDAQVTLTDDPAPGYVEPALGQCLVPSLPGDDFTPASDVSE